MNPKPAVALVLLAFTIEACTSPYVVSTVPQETPYWQTQVVSYSELLLRSSGKTVFIFMKDGRQTQGRLTHANADSITWTDTQVQKVTTVPTSRIDRLEIDHNYWWQGSVAGFLACTVPLVWAGAWAPGQQGNSQTPDYTGRTFVYAGAITGILLGGVTGALIIHADEFQIKPDSASDNLRKEIRK